MTSAEIRQSFLDFFKSKNHTCVPSSSLMPDAPNLLFTNAGMNQFVPIFLGQQKCPYTPARAADTQKCIRAGGKHNDLEDVGMDTYHHTFFEMLGNWSFGDYFKKEAIEWAWELVTGVWGFPKNRVYATVYKPGPGDPAEYDQEAYDYWAMLFTAAGLDPAVHIVNGNKKDNFWMMGETGPCGPCSELHIDLTPDGTTKGALVNKGSSDCIEIWNLVFIQFTANADGSFSPLPARHVDTGAGFERICSIIQCTDNFKSFTRTISNYETDVFRPLFDDLSKLSGKRYASTLPKPGATGLTEQEKTDIAFRVIADHIRTLTFSIADGIIPGNNDRNYVLRRILRRAVKYGRNLGFTEPFMYKLVPVLCQQMGPVFTEINSKMEKVQQVIKGEEESFNKTLDRGLELFNRVASQIKKSGKNIFPGVEAFTLSDTYGFPVDLTELMARELELNVDLAGYEVEMDKQKKRSQEHQKKEIIEVTDIWEKSKTVFRGYQNLSVEAKVVSVETLKGKFVVILDQTPFYAEMGGQVGDQGVLVADSKEYRVTNTIKAGDTFVHILESNDAPAVGTKVTASVDKKRRAAIEGHHSATHIFHWALHELVSKDAGQKGSYVGPDRLRFDFNCGPLTKDQIGKIETAVNGKISANEPVISTEKTYLEIKQDTSIQQFFGDKYGDIVRVVDIGGYSMELCGGTHVSRTGDIGYFKVTTEGAIAAGVRRIEAVTGAAAVTYLKSEIQKGQKKLGEMQPRIIEAGLNSGRYSGESDEVNELDKTLQNLTTELADLEIKLTDADKAKHKKAEQAAQQEALLLLPELMAENPAPLVRNLGTRTSEFLKILADNLKVKYQGPFVLGAITGEGKVGLVAGSPAPYVQKGFHAGNIIKEIAPMVGGGGGGKPEFAQAGGKDPSKLDEALAKAKEVLAKLN